jgi:nucleotide-binding universal stress UspA family protein
MKTILAATDYSPAASNALEYAAALAQATHARLVIFNVFSLATPSSSAPFSMPTVDELIKLNNQRLTLIGEILAETYGLEIEAVTTTSQFMEGLLKQVRKQQANLVVMGMRGSSLTTQLFGSTATAAIKEAKFPVLIVPEEANFYGIRRMLFACDYQYLTRSSNLSPIQDLATTLKAKVQILHVEKIDSPLDSPLTIPLKKNRPDMEALLEGIKHEYKFLRETNIALGIEKGIEDYNADLLVMVPHKMKFWESIFRPSLTRKLAMHAHIPLLALPNRRTRSIRRINNRRPEQAQP